ncbi:MAG TPA: type VI secretion system protein IglI family protein [Cellvibrio sp.]|nr:type VI secretion system protein IglI family protein [Cellvibrio sp.]
MSPANINNITIAKLNELTDFTHVAITSWLNVTNAPMDPDECFSSLASQWQQGNYSGIIEHCETLPLNYLCDIRICVYYMYSVLWGRENISLAQLINILANIIAHQQQITTQEHHRHPMSKIPGKSLGLFLRKVLTHLENSSPAASTTDQQEQVMAAVDCLQKTIVDNAIYIDEETEGLLMKTYQFFSTIVEQSHQTDDQTQDYQQDTGAITQPEDTKSLAEDFPKTPHDARNPIACTHSPIDKPLFNHSYRLQHLLEKMQALHTLLDNEQDLKAAVVLADIQSELDNFNPLIYFPEYFSNFAGLRARCASRLEPLFSHHESYQWQVLNDYYHTDITAFVNSESEIDSAVLSGSFNRESGYEPGTSGEGYIGDYDE